METRFSKDPNTKTKLNTNLDIDLSLNTSAFFLQSNGLSHDGDDHFEMSDIEMITLKSASYTSLKDLLPASPQAGPAVITSPTKNSSWHEIPIKNPLVKQAALAYLQPMSSPPEVGDNRGLFGKFMDVFCCWCQCECFGWINGVVFRTMGDDEDGDDQKLD